MLFLRWAVLQISLAKARFRGNEFWFIGLFGQVRVLFNKSGCYSTVSAEIGHSLQVQYLWIEGKVSICPLQKPIPIGEKRIGRHQIQKGHRQLFLISMRCTALDDFDLYARLRKRTSPNCPRVFAFICGQRWIKSCHSAIGFPVCGQV
jgi:hypothetical protein